MATYWTAEVTPLAVTSLIPMFMFPMLGILPAARTSAHYFKVSLSYSLIPWIINEIVTVKYHKIYRIKYTK